MAGLSPSTMLYLRKRKWRTLRQALHDRRYDQLNRALLERERQLGVWPRNAVLRFVYDPLRKRMCLKNTFLY